MTTFLHLCRTLLYNSYENQVEPWVEPELPIGVVPEEHQGDIETGDADVEPELPVGVILETRQQGNNHTEETEGEHTLPNTGVADNFTVFGAAASAIIASLGLVVPGKKKD